ncbi:MAG TPA: Ig-like domain-containing protein [Candidatus Limnocylindrales bacterium]|nr:Ig-like domain-containing protein [Candidatus Limnocylindrales bacterium]
MTRRHRARRTAAALLTLQMMLLGSAPVATARYDPDPGDEGSPGSTPIHPPPYVFPTNGFSWSAPDRYSQWDDAWHEFGGIPKPWQRETYDPEYVNPTTWYLNFMGCQSEQDYGYENYPDAKDEDGKPIFAKPTRRYTWRWNGKTRGPSTDCYTYLDFPAQGNYWVELTVKEADGSIETYTQPVRVKDYLIVVLGDSSASGEGAVDRPVYPELATPYEQNADWVDDRCHRSANAGGAQAARLLEDADPTSSVTFLSFACSGATLDTTRYNTGTFDVLDPYNANPGLVRGTGITGPYAGMEPPPNGEGPYQVGPQTLQLHYALTGQNAHAPRKVDSLLVAGGINDVRFADLVGVCILETLCHQQPVGQNGLTLSEQFDEDLERVVPGWQKLGAQLDGYGIQVEDGMKLALEYPGFFENDNGLRCPELFEDITVLGSWDFDEIGVAEAVWAVKLNEAVEVGADLAGFTYVSGIYEAFEKHGMCANDRYINTATDSMITQGDAYGTIYGSQSETTGTAHPNTKGYGAYAKIIIEQHWQSFLANEPPVANEDEVNAAFHFGSKFNVLANDSDPDGDPLSVRVTSPVAHGFLELLPNGEASYRPNWNYLGADSFTYEVTDGEFTSEAVVDITVAPLEVLSTEVQYGTTTPIGGMLGGFHMDPPYVVVFDKPLRPKRGLIAQIPGEDAVLYTAPERRRRVKLPYTVYSEAPPPSTDAGKSVRGMLLINVRRP